MKVAVVGAGLIGSAAARHLAKAGHTVLLIGPGEPDDWASHTGVFASHYDEGRITRVNDRRSYFAQATAASIARYGDIQAESGISFFTPCGALIAGGADYMAAVEKARRGLNVGCDRLDADGLRDRFPFLALPHGFSGDIEPQNAGHISPRNLVAAQQKAAQRFGATRVSEEATGLAPGRVTTRTDGFAVDEVIVAAGGWTDDLLGRANLEVYARTVALHEVGPAEAARLATMPSVVMESDDDIYILPPVLYPDGKLWLKLGGDPTDDLLPDKAAITDWFQSGGNARRAEYLTDRLSQIIPGFQFESQHHKPCVTTWSKDRLPEIRRLEPGLTIAAAGNGAGAKCSDELGRRAASISTGDTP